MHKELLADEHGIADACPVACEEFKQWVVEDDFPSGRPDWEAVDVIMVKGEHGVHVYESMKLRLLNASHSALAYVSYLSGHRIVSEAMADPGVLGFVEAFLDEVLPTIPEVGGISLPGYRSSLLERFSNPHIKDTVLRLAEDGSQKLQTTMRPVLLEQIAAGKRFDVMALAIAGWIRFMSGTDEAGAVIEGIKDPQGGAKLIEMAAGVVASPTAETVSPFLLEYFGAEVANSPIAVESIVASLTAINEKGTRSVLSQFE
jgi:mannitol-1-phosphate/altronate dehydrogenase